MLLEVLGIDPVFSNSPESRGRIERAHRTARNRLARQLRRRVYATVKDQLGDRPRVISVLNKRLHSRYIPQNNSRYPVAASGEVNSHRPLTSVQTRGLPLLMTKETMVRMDRSGMARYENVFYKTSKSNAINNSACKVRPVIQIKEHYDGAIRFFYQWREIDMAKGADGARKAIKEA